ncbi:MAG: sigma-70 family RNA polymerase sigma factor [Verrucomicrobiota bacterium]|nr:sigma-70 family RNA polymerase sigma factor [Verrucomicrobiota bacterium]
MADKSPAIASRMDSSAEAASSAGLSDPRQWVELHGDYLFRYALIRVRNATMAEDLAQETLLAALQAKDRFIGDCSERGWLTGILRHKVLDHFRQQSQERISQTESMPEELEGRFDDVGVWKHDPPLGPNEWGEDAAAQMQRKEFMAALRQCLDKLPRRCADAFILREMEATESGKIQELLGVSASNFWVLLHRARMQLRLCLEQNWLKP